jgi:hypothetical protein
MQTMSHLSLQPAVGARVMGGFAESFVHVMKAQAVKPTRPRCPPIAVLHHSAAKAGTPKLISAHALEQRLPATALSPLLLTEERAPRQRCTSER